MQSFVKIKSSRNGEITLSFTDICKSCPSLEFLPSQVGILTLFAKISGFTVVFCILKCILILWTWNVKFNHNTFVHFVYSNKYKWTNKTKHLLKFMKVFSLSAGIWNSKSCQFHAAHASFILIILFLALQRLILEQCQKYQLLETSLN